MKNRVIILLALVLVIGCGNDKKKNQLPASDLNAQTFARVYTNYLTALLADSTAEESREALLDSVLAQSGMSLAVFKEILYDLRENPEKFDAALTMTIDSLASMARSRQQEPPQP